MSADRPRDDGDHSNDLGYHPQPAAADQDTGDFEDLIRLMDEVAPDYHSPIGGAVESG